MCFPFLAHTVLLTPSACLPIAFAQTRLLLPPSHLQLPGGTPRGRRSAQAHAFLAGCPTEAVPPAHVLLESPSSRAAPAVTAPVNFWLRSRSGGGCQRRWVETWAMHNWLSRPLPWHPLAWGWIGMHQADCGWHVQQQSLQRTTQTIGAAINPQTHSFTSIQGGGMQGGVRPCATSTANCLWAVDARTHTLMSPTHTCMLYDVLLVCRGS